MKKTRKILKGAPGAVKADFITMVIFSFFNEDHLLMIEG